MTSKPARIQYIIPALMLIAWLSGQAAAQTSIFTYQGRLKEDGQPADGSYDLRFILYNAGGGGSQVGSILYADDKSITAGLFTHELDFGAASFPGADRWLEVAVRDGAISNADRDPLTYALLNPRQHVTATPYACRARDADLLDGLSSAAFLQSVPNPALAYEQRGGRGYHYRNEFI